MRCAQLLGLSSLRGTWLALLLALAVPPPAAASADDATPIIHPWVGLGDGFIGSFTWPNVLFYAGAVAATPPLVYGVDEPVQRYFQQHNPLTQAFASTTLAVGWVTPVVLPLGLYLGGLATGASELATAGAAALQAAAVQAVIVTTLKWLTDRAGPYPNGDASQARWSGGLFHDSNDANRFNFNPFDIRGGLRWPSGHTASNIAIVSALVAFYPDEPWLAVVGYTLVLGIGLGMIEGDYHWLSDVVAGGLIGHIIGWTIGKQFRRRYDAAVSGNTARDPGVTYTIAPMSSPYGSGLSIIGQF